MPIKVGDIVAIRGDLRKKNDGSCQYLPEQLVDGKFLKHAGTGEIWTGQVTRVQGDMAKVGGGWRGVESYVPVSEINA
ncbi:hypothetical protein PAK_P30083 [Pseudomonas phage PAK_P3]|uniref:Uncharacterized protein n=2 Tax=Nankokuvirus PAKP3 TaxID=1925782 RepID=V5K3C8_9CAUD|nr:hypothetical protein PAK_P30083 [Pseudomonas phage PAK_P3]AGS81705.1 hypothetical protein P3_CHA0083 [Pseudomonas phage P3_CHA]AGS81824.1 hypothetical protein PAK_P30083 [Pseudomonas phage PAK_P3]